MTVFDPSQPPRQSGDWAMYLTEDCAERADGLAASVLTAATGLAHSVHFSPYRLVFEIYGLKAAFSFATVAELSRRVQATLGCPVHFVELRPSKLTLTVVHPLFAEGEMSTMDLMFLPPADLDDWLPQALAPLPAAAQAT